MPDSHDSRSRGFSLIELLIVVAIIGIIAAIAIPNLIASKRAANESSAVSSIRVLTSAQASYRSTAGNYADNLAELNTANLIDSVLGCAAEPCLKSGYNISIERVTGGTGVPMWNVTAVPHTSSGAMQTGSFSYYSNETGSIYFIAGDTPPTAGISDTNRVPSNGLALGS